MTLDLDQWLPSPAVRVAHRRESDLPGPALWDAARRVRLQDAGLLGRLVRWRIPGTPSATAFDELFRNPPFLVLDEDPQGALVSGLVGRIWTLRRDYPQLSVEEYREFSAPGNARVLLANWLEVDPGTGRAALCSESRVEVFGFQGRLGLRLVRPLIRRFGSLVGSDGLAAAVRLAERES